MYSDGRFVVLEEKRRKQEEERAAREQAFNTEVASLEKNIKAITSVEGAASAALIEPALRLAELLNFSKPLASVRCYETALVAIRSYSPVNVNMLIRALCGTAAALVRLDRTNEAEDSLREAIASANADQSVNAEGIAAAFSQLSEIEEARGNHEAALEHLVHWFNALERKTKAVLHVERYSALLVKADRHEEAIYALSNALETGYRVDLFRQRLLYQLAQVYGLINRVEDEECALKEAWIASSASDEEAQAEEWLRAFYKKEGRLRPTGVAQSFPVFVVSNRNWQQPYNHWILRRSPYRIHYGLIKFDVPWSEVVKRGRTTRADLLHISDEVCAEAPTKDMLHSMKIIADLKRLIWHRHEADKRNLNMLRDENGVKYWSIPKYGRSEALQD
jgi:tetratricopeptide (TPR) repeat protein